MKQLFLTLLIAFLTHQASARIGETPEQLKERRGAPLKESFDRDGYGLRIYKADGFKELRVTFVKGKSQFERYKLAEDNPAWDLVLEKLEKLKQENPGESFVPFTDRVQVGTEEPESELKFVTDSGQERSYSGDARYRIDGKDRTLVIRNNEAVIEIPLRQADPALNDLKPDTTYVVTVLDQNFDDLMTPLGIVSRREHVDWDDTVDDAHSSFQQLVRISTHTSTVFDRSVCSLHHVEMEKRNVDIAYGMLAYSKAESYCIAHYPNFRDYAVGGCMVVGDDTKSTQIYICPKCVVECNEYKRQHPQENKNPLD